MQIQNMRTDVKYRFSIVNFSKSDSLYNCGMKPVKYCYNLYLFVYVCVHTCIFRFCIQRLRPTVTLWVGPGSVIVFAITRMTRSRQDIKPRNEEKLDKIFEWEISLVYCTNQPQQSSSTINQSSSKTRVPPARSPLNFEHF